MDAYLCLLHLIIGAPRATLSLQGWLWLATVLVISCVLVPEQMYTSNHFISEWCVEMYRTCFPLQIARHALPCSAGAVAGALARHCPKTHVSCNAAKLVSAPCLVCCRQRAVVRVLGLAGIMVEPLFNAFATAAFFEFVTFAIFEMRYLLSIWRARRSSSLDAWAAQVGRS